MENKKRLFNSKKKSCKQSSIADQITTKEQYNVFGVPKVYNQKKTRA